VSSENEAEAGRLQGRLSVVATPIGNLEDITLRALRILREADIILAEDTRRTMGLCRHHGIGTPLHAFHAHTPRSKLDGLIERMRDGAHLAIVSDAGTPLISDPGAELVRAAIDADITVQAIPGANAPVTALVASGLLSHSFEFVGFLPRSGGRRARALLDIKRARGTVIVFEAPNRIGGTLRDLAITLGDLRQAAVCRELTKLHEEIARGTLSELAARFAEGALGEITLVIGAPDVPPDDEIEPTSDEEIVSWLEIEGLGTRDAAARLSERQNIGRKEAYQRVLALGVQREK
jgi:16S rRNA (cytidine1402-2'-O)-methyltransferase